MTNTNGVPDIRQQLGDRYAIERELGRGFALLMDFGISRSITAKVEQKGGATQGLTRVGEVVGPAEYMSPEQASGDVVDGRSDLYSLGLVALFALTGRPVISGESTQQILVRWFIRISSRGVAARTPGTTTPGMLRPPASLGLARRATATAPSTDRMRSLEDRVAALERWRDRSEPIA